MSPDNSTYNPLEVYGVVHDPEICNLNIIDFWYQENFHDVMYTINGTKYMVVNGISNLSIFMFYFLGWL